jgi:hypothetical protein
MRAAVIVVIDPGRPTPARDPARETASRWGARRASYWLKLLQKPFRMGLPGAMKRKVI